MTSPAYRRRFHSAIPSFPFAATEPPRRDTWQQSPSRGILTVSRLIVTEPVRRSMASTTTSSPIMAPMLKKFISGGQTGADLAGWQAAKAHGIPTGGAVPRGFLTEDAPAMSSTLL